MGEYYLEHRARNPLINHRHAVCFVKFLYRKLLINLFKSSMTSYEIKGMATDWTQLPQNILALIFEWLSYNAEDLYYFCFVCSPWRALALEDNHCYLLPKIPCLMIPNINCDTCKMHHILTSPIGKNIDKEPNLLQVSIPHEDLCYGSHQVWLIIF